MFSTDQKCLKDRTCAPFALSLPGSSAQCRAQHLSMQRSLNVCIEFQIWRLTETWWMDEQYLLHTMFLLETFCFSFKLASIKLLQQWLKTWVLAHPSFNPSNLTTKTVTLNQKPVLYLTDVKKHKHLIFSLTIHPAECKDTVCFSFKNISFETIVEIFISL
jgi:hypothetical protein